jgi:hypothetical protein
MPTPKQTSLTPSAAEQRATETQARELIAKFAPEQAKLVAAMRKALRKRLPTAFEVVYEYRSWFVLSYSPTEHGYDGVLAIRGDADGVKFYFNQGKDLPDPEKLLKGSAQVRYIDVEKSSTLNRPEVAALIDEAIARSKVPFPSAGKGSVVLSDSTKKVKKKAGKPRARK